jgi:hypothetical protein
VLGEIILGLVTAIAQLASGTRPWSLDAHEQYAKTTSTKPPPYLDIIIPTARKQQISWDSSAQQY